jgi:hypothetical protein
MVRAATLVVLITSSRVEGAALFRARAPPIAVIEQEQPQEYECP